MSCVIVKPDGVGKSVVGKIIDRLEGEGFRLLAARMIRPTVEQFSDFYAEHRGKPFYDGLLKFMTSGPLVVTAWDGENVIPRVRALIGSTNPKEAMLGTFRAQWGTDNRRNLVHASDSAVSGRRETAFFFTADELASYDPSRWSRPEFAPPVLV
ncbi:MAG: nucleoside-diphosphate kinase [Elusimicrobia bacterium]|nr:nucleoside-diphosphate kinase [Elusimicrobiota bacterium]